MAEQKPKSKFQLKPKSDRITDAVEAIWKHLLTLDRGGLLTYETMEKLGGLEKDVAPWDSVVRKLEKRHEHDRGITLMNIATIGYHLCTVDEQIKVMVEKRIKRAQRQQKKAAGHLESAPAEEMTQHQQVVRATLLQSNRDSQKKLRQNRRVLGILMKPTGDNPGNEDQ